MSLKGRAVIVTGSGSGIGQAVALQLAEAGARLALTDIDAEAGRLTCEEIRRAFPNADVVFAVLDASREEDAGKLVRSFSKTYGHLDGLVNCAGIFGLTSLETSAAQFQRIMAVNLEGTVNFTQHFLKEVVKYGRAERETPEGGYSIVNIGSNAILRSIALSAAYNASKHAVLGYSRTIAKDYAEHGVRINVVSAGQTNTNILRDVTDTDHLDDMIEDIPMKRRAEPVEIANVVLFLLGPGASYVTGANWPVDGGITC